MIRGTDAQTVRTALESGDPFPGTFGFAGEVDGRLVRDVLGRVPLFVERDVADPGDDEWAFSPEDLEDPVLFPAGSVAEGRERTQVWELPDLEAIADHDRAIDRVEEAIHTAVDAVEYDRGDVAVAFSGGVDSALVAELLDAPCYVVGFPGSNDLEAARIAADAMGRDLEVVELTHEDLERAVPTVARAIGRTNAMDVGIALSLYLVAEAVAEDGYEALAVGQGADELFGGYEKVVHLDHRVEAETTRGAVREQIATLPEQLPRDVCAIEATGLEPIAPFLHDSVVEAALRLPPELLADEEERKRALRRVSRAYLPTEVANRDKKAVQYGSLVARELDRLARQSGYKRRIGDHVRKYVESLL
ncbi:asparagine synthase C-terminal domain-containing protein [Natrialbaceae archaeon A-gly3]